MILDLPRFIQLEQPSWKELESVLARLETDPARRLELKEIERFHYLFEKVSSDLARIATFSSEPRLHAYLESLVARAYGEIHGSRHKSANFRPVRWFLAAFPAAFRRHRRAFQVALAATIIGLVFGGGVALVDPAEKAALLPFSHLHGSPSERVAEEESAKTDRLGGSRATFSGFLMTHNIKVAIFTFSLGLTWGIGSIILLFYNGVILGLVAVDYILDGQTLFLLGWLLPHGVIEIPAFLVGGQAGLVLAHALIGHADRRVLRERLRSALPDLCVLVYGFAVLLVWAGLVEAFLSQYHEPVIPYGLKIFFGVAELALLVALLTRGGRGQSLPEAGQ